MTHGAATNACAMCRGPYEFFSDLAAYNHRIRQLCDIPPKPYQQGMKNLWYGLMICRKAV